MQNWAKRKPFIRIYLKYYNFDTRMIFEFAYYGGGVKYKGGSDPSIDYGYTFYFNFLIFCNKYSAWKELLRILDRSWIMRFNMPCFAVFFYLCCIFRGCFFLLLLLFFLNFLMFHNKYAAWNELLRIQVKSWIINLYMLFVVFFYWCCSWYFERVLLQERAFPNPLYHMVEPVRRIGRTRFDRLISLSFISIDCGVFRTLSNTHHRCLTGPYIRVLPNWQLHNQRFTVETLLYCLLKFVILGKSLLWQH